VLIQTSPRDHALPHAVYPIPTSPFTPVGPASATSRSPRRCVIARDRSSSRRMILHQDAQHSSRPTDNADGVAMPWPARSDAETCPFAPDGEQYGRIELPEARIPWCRCRQRRLPRSERISPNRWSRGADHDIEPVGMRHEFARENEMFTCPISPRKFSSPSSKRSSQ